MKRSRHTDLYADFCTEEDDEDPTLKKESSNEVDVPSVPKEFWGACLSSLTSSSTVPSTSANNLALRDHLTVTPTSTWSLTSQTKQISPEGTVGTAPEGNAPITLERNEQERTGSATAVDEAAKSLFEQLQRNPGYADDIVAGALMELSHSSWNFTAASGASAPGWSALPVPQSSEDRELAEEELHSLLVLMERQSFEATTSPPTLDTMCPSLEEPSTSRNAAPKSTVSTLTPASTSLAPPNIVPPAKVLQNNTDLIVESSRENKEIIRKKKYNELVNMESEMMIKFSIGVPIDRAELDRLKQERLRYEYPEETTEVQPADVLQNTTDGFVELENQTEEILSTTARRNKYNELLDMESEMIINLTIGVPIDLDELYRIREEMRKYADPEDISKRILTSTSIDESTSQSPGTVWAVPVERAVIKKQLKGIWSMTEAQSIYDENRNWFYVFLERLQRSKENRDEIVAEGLLKLSTSPSEEMKTWATTLKGAMGPSAHRDIKALTELELSTLGVLLELSSPVSEQDFTLGDTATSVQADVESPVLPSLVEEATQPSCSKGTAKKTDNDASTSTQVAVLPSSVKASGLTAASTSCSPSTSTNNGGSSSSSTQTTVPTAAVSTSVTVSTKPSMKKRKASALTSASTSCGTSTSTDASTNAAAATTSINADTLSLKDASKKSKFSTSIAASTSCGALTSTDTDASTAMDTHILQSRGSRVPTRIIFRGRNVALAGKTWKKAIDSHFENYRKRREARIQSRSILPSSHLQIARVTTMAEQIQTARYNNLAQIEAELLRKFKHGRVIEKNYLSRIRQEMMELDDQATANDADIDIAAIWRSSESQ